jgi:uracil-DNA glycosylase
VTPEAKLTQIMTAWTASGQLPQLAHLRASSRFVPGDGPVTSPVVVCGEGPGEDEEETGHPFTGPAGRRLNSQLSEAGIPRGACYVTNVLKFRCTDGNGRNRAPFFPEISASVPCLLEEIAIVSPLVILSMGATALKALGPRLVLSEVHGRFQDVFLGARTYRLLPLWHPARCLRDPESDRQVREALRQLIPARAVA